jgi:hypothetical protein
MIRKIGGKITKGTIGGQPLMPNDENLDHELRTDKLLEPETGATAGGATTSLDMVSNVALTGG